MKVRKLIFFVINIVISYSAYGLTETELKALENFSALPSEIVYSPRKVFIDFNVISSSQKKYFPPLSLQETRARLKERLAVEINPSWRIGLDSFKASPTDRSIIDWPIATQPKSCKARSHKGYGVGVRMKLD